MSKHIYLLFIFILIFTSCEDVIEVEVPTAAPRLVIEASIDWEKGTNGNNQNIKLSLSTPFFNRTTNSAISGAKVKVTNNNDKTEVVFIDQGDGNYTTTAFKPFINQSYTLEIVYKNEIYLATEKLTPVTDITNIYQSTENGFDDEAIEINIYFTDPKDEENYYLTKFHDRKDLFAELFPDSDEFTNGNEMIFFYEKIEDDKDKELQPGDIVDIYLYGISEQYYNFIGLLISQSKDGGLFSTTPAEIKGNCINITTKNNYAFGYFRLTQVDKHVYIVQ